MALNKDSKQILWEEGYSDSSEVISISISSLAHYLALKENN